MLEKCIDRTFLWCVNGDKGTLVHIVRWTLRYSFWAICVALKGAVGEKSQAARPGEMLSLSPFSQVRRSAPGAKMTRS